MMKKSVALSVFVTAFLDLVGFSIIFPLFPQLLDHYLALEGPDSAIGRLAAFLAELAGEGAAGGADRRFLVVVLFGGALGSLYSLLQFAFAPVWGGVSDRIGRRPTLLLTLAGTIASYAIWFFAGTFSALVAGRLLGGLMAGNISTITAVVSDTTAPEERSRGMAVVGAAIGIGFVIGPAIGGVSSFVDLGALWPDGTRLGVNPFSAAAGAAFLLGVVNLALVWARLPETLPPERRAARVGAGGARTANPLKIFRGIGLPGVQRATILSFLYLTAFSAMEFTLTFLAVERFGYTPRDNAKMFVFVGVMIALTQGGLVRRLAKLWDDRTLVRAGLVAILPGFIVVGFAESTPMLFAGLAFMAMGSAFATPCLGALVSRYAPADQQGLALGLFRSMGALSRAVGPVLGGVLYWKFGAQSPYAVGAALLSIPIWLSLGLPPPP